MYHYSKQPREGQIIMKKSFYDIIALLSGVYNVEWDEEYELYEVDDFFIDNNKELFLKSAVVTAGEIKEAG